MTIAPTGINFFFPEQNNTLVVTTATANVNVSGSGDVLVVANVGAVEAFIGWGLDATVAVAATSRADRPMSSLATNALFFMKSPFRVGQVAETAMQTPRFSDCSMCRLRCPVNTANAVGDR